MNANDFAWYDFKRNQSEDHRNFIVNTLQTDVSRKILYTLIAESKETFVSNRSQMSISCVHISQWYRCRQKQSGSLHLQHCPLSSFDTRFSSLLAYFFFLFPKSKARINNDTAFSNCSHPAFHRFSLSCWAWLARIPKASLSETLTSVTLKILRLRMLSCPSSYYSAQSLALRAYPQNVCGKCSLMTDCWLYVVQWF